MKLLNANLAAFKDFNKKGEITNHLKAIESGFSAFFWPIVDTPKMIIDNAKESSLFYGNKIKMLKNAD